MDEARRIDAPPPGGTGRSARLRLVALGFVLAIATSLALALLANGTLHFDRPRLAAGQAPRIAIVDKDGGLSTVAADGSDRRAYPVGSMAFQFPAWSPDGSHVAAIGHDSAEAGIFVVDDHGANPGRPPAAAFRSADELPIYLYWAPNGQRITFITSEPDGLALQVVAADASAPATVIRRGQPLYWDWVDGSHLLVHSGANLPNAFLGEVGVDNAEAKSITSSVGPFQAPAISAGARYRAYVVMGDSSTSLVVEARDGSSHREASVAGASAIGWSPAGDQLGYTAAAVQFGLPIGPLQLIDARSGAVRTLLGGPVVSWFWAPDGRTIAALRIPLPGEDQVASLSAVAATGSGPIAQADPLSLRLLFVDVASGTLRSERAVRLSDIVLAQFLPFFDQYARSHRLWSPLSDGIVLPLQDETGAGHVTIVPADGSKPRPIADGVAAFWSP
jgi:TolB protein